MSHPKDYKVTGGVCKITSGYLWFYDPNHCLAYCNGMVYLHRHVASVKIGRWLDSEEHVHHIDGDKTNNCQSNLQIVSSSEHSKMHHPKTLSNIVCPVCLNEFKIIKSDRKYCSMKCYRKIKPNRCPSKEELITLIKDGSYVGVGKILGVSDNAVKKWCKKYGIVSPKSHK